MSAIRELEFIQYAEEEARDRARNSLLAFTKYTKPDYNINWHNRLMFKYVDAWVRGEIQYLMVFMPPRHGKSEGVSRRLPPYLLGRDPKCEVISATYGGSLSTSMARDVKNIIEGERYKELFPAVKLPDRNSILQNTSSAFQIPPQFAGDKVGSYRSASVNGSISGRGADWFIIDDPIKNQEEADSFVYRERVWNWYTSTAFSRLEGKGSMLVTTTRWHEDDLAGRILKQMKDDKSAAQYVVLNLPAVFDVEKERSIGDTRQLGEVLWRAKYDEERMQTIKATVGSRVWEALYQQRPTSPSGNVIKRDWFKWYHTPPEVVDDVIMVWDMSFKGGDNSDYVVGQVWARAGARKYLIDQVRGQMTFTQTRAVFESFCAKHPLAYTKLVEDTANGPAIISSLEETIPGIVAFKPKDSKVARLSAVSVEFEAGNVFLPEPGTASWIHDYVEEMVSFPNGAHDDQVDCTSAALLRFREDNLDYWKSFESM